MARERDEALWAEWRGRVARCERRAETSAEFCRREGVSVASRFSWRRRLATETAMTESVAAPTLRPATPTFLPVRLSTRRFSDAEVDGRVEIERPDGAVVRLSGDAERLLRDAIEAAGAPSAEVSSC